MKAISLHQPWASLIADGDKTIETRWRKTNFRGNLLICSTKKPIVRDLPCGYALAIVTVWDCIPYCTDHAKRAGFDRAKIVALDTMLGLPRFQNTDLWSWMLKDIRRIKEPFKVTGRQGFFNVEPLSVVQLENVTKEDE